MNDISEIDQVLLKRLKQKIEQHAGLPGNADINQKDFDFLLFYIQDKTGHALSLTTLKRIWRNEFQRLPHLSTLNMLAFLADAKDWHTLKKEFIEERARQATGNGLKHHLVHAPVGSQAIRPRRRNVKLVFAIAAVILIIAFAGRFWYNASVRPARDVSTVEFSAISTADLRIPNSVIFSYDVKGIRADHFYIQQSWDPGRKVEVSPTNNKQTDIYYEPGYHYAKLLADDRAIKETPVHIKYNNWYVRFRYPESQLAKVNDADLHTDGYLGLNPDYVATRFHPLNDQFQLGYMLSKDFNMSADELEFQGTVRFDSVHAPACPTIQLLIKGDRDYTWITLSNTGCESNAGLKVGNTHVNGKTNDLSQLGIDVFSWQKIEISLSGGTARVSVNDRVIRHETYSNSLGELKEVDFFFNGIGSIDNIHIRDQQGHYQLSQRF